MSAITSSLAFEALESDEQELKVFNGRSFRPALSLRSKTAKMGQEDVFHTTDTEAVTNVVCIKGKMTVSF